MPRHPPCALKNLSHKDARVHCVVLNIRAAPHQTPAHTPTHGRQSTSQAGPTTNTQPTTPHTVQRNPVGLFRWPSGTSSRPNPQDPTTCPDTRTPPCRRSTTPTTHTTCTGLQVLATRRGRADIHDRCSTQEHPAAGHSPAQPGTTTTTKQ